VGIVGEGHGLALTSRRLGLTERARAAGASARQRPALPGPRTAQHLTGCPIPNGEQRRPVGRQVVEQVGAAFVVERLGQHLTDDPRVLDRKSERHPGLVLDVLEQFHGRKCLVALPAVERLANTLRKPLGHCPGGLLGEALANNLQGGAHGALRRVPRREPAPPADLLDKDLLVHGVGDCQTRAGERPRATANRRRLAAALSARKHLLSAEVAASIWHPPRSGLEAGLVRTPLDQGVHAIRLLEMPAFVESVLRDLDKAQRRVLIEAYIFRSDRFARMIGERLVRAARRGVEVRLLFDASGSRAGDPEYFHRLARRGVHVRAYRRAGLLLGRLSPAIRDHSRILVVDTAAYTGGHAWADPWLPRALGGGGWHDLSCRVVGPVVEDFSTLFEERWREAMGSPPVDYDTSDRYPDVRLLSDGPAGTPLLQEAFVDSFRRARRRIWIENAYFYPATSYLAALVGAARRGVDVRIIVPARSNVPMVARAARAAYGPWLRAGLNVYEYVPSLLHGKVALVDEAWCTIGSFNANPTSIRLSIELSLVCYDPALSAALAAQLRKDMNLSRRITEQDIAALGRSERVLDRVARGLLELADVALSWR
jgi:cardiolipin synthase A/B